MKCKEVLSLLSSYIDGEVSREETCQIEEHLEDCKSCSSALAELRSTISVLSNIDEAQIPEEVAGQIKSVIREEEQNRAKKKSPATDSHGIFSRKVATSLVVLSGLMALAIVILILLRIFWPLQTTVNFTPKSLETQTSQDKMQDGAQEESEATSELQKAGIDQVRVIQTSTNYDQKGLSELLASYEGQKEKETSEAEEFSVDTRDGDIANMLRQAQELKLDASHLAQCFDVLIARDDAMVPIYGELSYFEGREVWIIIVKDFSADSGRFSFRAYALSTPVCEILYETD